MLNADSLALTTASKDREGGNTRQTESKKEKTAFKGRDDDLRAWASAPRQFRVAGGRRGSGASGGQVGLGAMRESLTRAKISVPFGVCAKLFALLVRRKARRLGFSGKLKETKGGSSV
ncbi:hypothetical protein TRVL_03530 [Trypanosoma vivax]|nr:hypothetical protein TRVL_03530 [Trypanosoma vivax]